jgi:cystathionine gamma-synthase
MAGFETRAVHVGQEPDPVSGAVVPPIGLSTTFVQTDVGVPVGPHDYSRAGNPTRDGLERQIASLEGARHGFAFASGLAAIDTVLRLLTPGDHLLIPHDAYGGTFRLVDKLFRPAGILADPVDMSDPRAVEAAWRPNTRLVLVESPSNPTLSIVDLRAVGEIGRALGGLVVVDNTFATPYLQRPIELGAHVVVHSLTKYLGGHSDVLGGFVAVDDDELAEQIRFRQKAVGAVLSPFDAYLTARGVKTLAVRLDRQCETAEHLAQLLQEHPQVLEVLYPGLPDHPGHDVAKRQMTRFGGMLSFVLAGGQAAAERLVTRTKVFTLAESLGAVESLIEHPATMTHAVLQGTALQVDPGLVRLSIGLETLADLADDLWQALDSLSGTGADR